MRELFALDPDLVFLNHGSFGACPREVLDAQFRWMLEMERNPVAFLGRRSAALLAQAREKLAATLGADAKNLVFVSNATTAVNIVAQSLDLKAGDEVLATDHEYGACETALERICKSRGASYRRVTIPVPYEKGQFVERMMSEAGSRTRVIFASHISSSTALIFPAAELCAAARQRGILTLIDGAHAPGQIPLQINEIGSDFYAGNCHKWLCAPKGSGFLNVRPEHHDTLHAPVVSWGYSEVAKGNAAFESYLGHSTLEQRLQWLGTRDISAWLSVASAIDFQAQHNWPSLRTNCHALAAQAQEVLTQRHGTSPIAQNDDWAQMVAIPVATTNADQLRTQLLQESGIEIHATTHKGQVFLRVSVQAYNTQSDITKLLAAPALR
jgi:isopenicillin-N epimerase